jgi:hypothetical protein
MTTSEPALLRRHAAFTLAALPNAHLIELSSGSTPPGWFLTNPSICRHGDGYAVTAKAINYDVERILHHTHQWQSDDGDRMRAVNLLLELDRDFSLRSEGLIDETWARLRPELAGWTEDYRCFSLANQLYVVGSGINQGFAWAPSGWYAKDLRYRSFLGRITSARCLKVLRSFHSPTGAQRDKNWVPAVRPKPVPRLDLILNPASAAHLSLRFHAPDRVSRPRRSHRFSKRPYRWNGPWSGSSGALRIDPHWAFILHRRVEGHGTLEYQHKLVITDDRYTAVAESPPFAFEGPGIEFCCGISEHHDPGSLCIAYGRRDKFSRLLILPRADLLAFAAPL